MNMKAWEAMEAGIQKLVTAITDEQGDLRPISRIEFEIIGRQVRWSLWEGSTRLHTRLIERNMPRDSWSPRPISWRCWQRMQQELDDLPGF